MAKHIDISGSRFGRLLAIEKVGSDKKGRALWNCKCDCGNVCVKTSEHIRSGNTKSCGCLMVSVFNTVNKTHGKSSHPLYAVWRGMKSRCYNPNKENYRNYGGRGIQVCEEWRGDFYSFYTWATHNGWKKGLEIDRIDNDKGYSPENCRCVTKAENLKNKRR
jgi:hypothetical protein